MVGGKPKVYVVDFGNSYLSTDLTSDDLAEKLTSLDVMHRGVRELVFEDDISKFMKALEL
jgi:hypothetical protein